MSINISTYASGKHIANETKNTLSKYIFWIGFDSIQMLWKHIGKIFFVSKTLQFQVPKLRNVKINSSNIVNTKISMCNTCVFLSALFWSWAFIFHHLIFSSVLLSHFVFFQYWATISIPALLRTGSSESVIIVHIFKLRGCHFCFTDVSELYIGLFVPLDTCKRWWYAKLKKEK